MQPVLHVTHAHLIPQFIARAKKIRSDFKIYVYYGDMQKHEYGTKADDLSTLLTKCHEVFNSIKPAKGVVIVTAYETWRVRHGPQGLPHWAQLHKGLNKGTLSSL